METPQVMETLRGYENPQVMELFRGYGNLYAVVETPQRLWNLSEVMETPERCGHRV